MISKSNQTDILLSPQEVDTLHDEFIKLEDWPKFLEFVKENYNDRFLFVTKGRSIVPFSLKEHDNCEKTNLYDAIADFPKRSFTIYSGLVRNFRQIGSFYYVVNGFYEFEDGKRFATKEEAIAFVHDNIDEIATSIIFQGKAEILGNGEIIVFREEDVISKYANKELLESITNSQYSFNEITPEILLNEFYDCKLA